MAVKIELALYFARTRGRTNGRQRIMALSLDSESVARRVVEVYEKVIQERGKRWKGQGRMVIGNYKFEIIHHIPHI